LDLNLCFEWISFCFSWFLLHPANHRGARLLIPILGVTVAAESLGFYYRVVLRRTTNHVIYNFSVPLIILLFLLLFGRGLQWRGNRKVMKWMIPAYLLFVVIDLSWIQGVGRFATYDYIVGSLALVITTSLYYLELIRKKEYVFLSAEPLFWIAAAVLLLYLPKAVLYSVFEYLAYKNVLARRFGEMFQLANRILSVIFFGLLAYASLCRLISRN
jgi:hypothetical protein